MAKKPTNKPEVEEAIAPEVQPDGTVADNEGNELTPANAETAEAVGEATAEDKDTGSSAAESEAGSEIAKAITEGLKEAKEDKTIKIVTDESVVPRFSLVENNEGKILLRENETGHLSKLQLKSIEETEADTQDQEVKEV